MAVGPQAGLQGVGWLARKIKGWQEALCHGRGSLPENETFARPRVAIVARAYFPSKLGVKYKAVSVLHLSCTHALGHATQHSLSLEADYIPAR